MRKMRDSSKAPCSVAFSARAEARSRPNGFSTTTRALRAQLERPVGPRDADDRPVEMAAPGHRLETREYLLRHDRALRPAREIAAGPLPPRARASRPIAHPASLRHIAPSPTAGIIERVCARR